MLLQTLNALFFPGLPGSLELNQQLANHFTEKVTHFMHIPHFVLGHISYLRHAFTACIQESIQFTMAARPIAALPATRCCINSCKTQTLSQLWSERAEKLVAPYSPPLLKGSVTCFAVLHQSYQGPHVMLKLAVP